MNYDEGKLLESNPDLAHLGKIIEKIDRPGEYVASGQIVAPMPRLEVEGVGVVSFPVPSFQAEELRAKAAAAPYGRGQETIYDPSVRDCGQIEPDKLSLSGAAWADTLNQIVRRAETALGCPENSVSAELYKLLAYEPGGFFAPHRDTEKADGMLATLVLALPGSGKGGELVVRHHGRETEIDMRSDDPSVLNFAAFYADCEHEVRPITDGHRICLVYNLVLKPGGGASLSAPDFSSQAEPIARELRKAFERSGQDSAPGKIVWLLEHDYSEAGLSFDTLKNVDAVHARILAAAADRADCAIHAAVLHVSEAASATYYGWDDEIEDLDEDDYEVVEIYDWESHLENWVGRAGEFAEFGKMELGENELIPTGRLDYAKPDRVTLTEASGNAGASVDRLYLRTALVMWPSEQSSLAIAASGAGTLASFLNNQQERQRNGESIFAPIEKLAESAAAHWPKSGFRFGERAKDWETATASALELICKVARPATANRFFLEVVKPNYSSEMNDSILAAARLLGANRIQNAIRELVEKNFSGKADAVAGLVLQLSDDLDVDPDSGWQGALTEIVDAIAGKVAVFGQKMDEDANDNPYRYSYRREPKPLLADTLAKYFTLIWRYRLEDRTEHASAHLLESPKIVEPERTVPVFLDILVQNRPEEAGRSVAMRSLWNLSAKSLIARSAVPPTPPADWVTPASELDCKCSLCKEIRKFCADSRNEVFRFPTAQSNRSHIREECKDAGIDMKFHTERKGRPYVLICTKTRTRHDRRLKEYKQDVECMQLLAKAAETLTCQEDAVAKLRKAISNARP